MNQSGKVTSAPRHSFGRTGSQEMCSTIDFGIQTLFASGRLAVANNLAAWDSRISQSLRREALIDQEGRRWLLSFEIQTVYRHSKFRQPECV